MSNTPIGKPPIGPVLEHYGADRVPIGARWKAMRCPFHQDRSASASVNIDTAHFRCFACDISGDAFDVVQWKEVCDFVSARQFLETILGDSYQPVSGGSRTGRTRRNLFDGEAGPSVGQRNAFTPRRRHKPLAGA